MKRAIFFLIIGVLIFQNSSYANSVKDQLVEYQHSGHLQICTWDSNEISIINMNNNRAIPLMGNWGTHFNFSGCDLFPQGRFIAYSVSSPVFIKKDTVKIFDALNGNTKDLISFGVIAGFAISPDEKTMAIVADAEKRDFKFPEIADGTQGEAVTKYFQELQKIRSEFQSLYLLDMQTNKLDKVVDGNISSISNVAWSPNGTRLFYESGDGEHFIYTLTTKSSKKVLDRKASNLSWSADSNRIYFRYYGIDDNAYYSISSDGADKKLFMKNTGVWSIPLIDNIGEIATPIVSSPDGKMIIYSRYSGIKGYPLRVFAQDLKSNHTVELGSGNVCGWSFDDQMKYYQKDSA